MEMASRVEAAAADLLAEGRRALLALRQDYELCIEDIYSTANDLIQEASKSQSTYRKRKLKCQDANGGLIRKTQASRKISEISDLKINNTEVIDQTSKPYEVVPDPTVSLNTDKKSIANSLRANRRTTKKISTLPNISENIVKEQKYAENLGTDMVTDPIINNVNDSKSIIEENQHQDDNNGDVVIMPPPQILPKNKKKKNLVSEDSSSIELINETEKPKRIRRQKKVDSKLSTDESNKLRRVTRSNRNVLSCPDTAPASITKPRKMRKRKSSNDGESIDDPINSTDEHHEEKIQDMSNEKSKPEKKSTSKKNKRSKKEVPTSLDEEDVSVERQSVKLDEKENESTYHNSSSNDKTKLTNTKTVLSEVTEVKVEESEVESMDVDLVSDEPAQSPCYTTNENINEVTYKIDTTEVDSAKESEKKQTEFNETIVIDTGSPIISFPKGKTTESAKNNVVLNETVVLSSEIPATTNNNDDANNKENNEAPFDPSVSLLPDDVNEVAETPPKPIIPLTSTFIISSGDKAPDAEESPVKNRVKHFEKLAELGKKSKKDALDGQDAPRRITRNKIRPNYFETPEGEKKDKQINVASIKNKPPSGIVKKAISKTNLPVSATFIPVKNVPKTLLNITNNLVLSPKLVTQSSSALTTDAIQKKNAYLQAKTEEQRRKREKHCQAAAQVRKAQETLKKEQLERAEREKEERARYLQEEREERMREETEKKRLAQEIKAAEMEKRMQAAKQKQLEAASEKSKKHNLLEEQDIISGHRVSNYIANSNKIFDDMIEEDERMENSQISDRERKKVEDKRKPLWAKKENLEKILASQKYLNTSVIDRLYSSTKFSPNLVEIFPKIDRSKLKRTSSAVWKTPPRCSMMPMKFV